MRHWLPRYSGRPRQPRTLYYHSFSCTFDGTEKDLRPKVADWPDLVHDNDYSFCNRLDAEAKRLEIDGLVTWSARHDGSNLPVFVRRSLADPTPEGVLAMTYDPDTGHGDQFRPVDHRVVPHQSDGARVPASGQTDEFVRIQIRPQNAIA